LTVIHDVVIRHSHCAQANGGQALGTGDRHSKDGASLEDGRRLSDEWAFQIGDEQIGLPYS
jgi:hypothetical protein